MVNKLIFLLLVALTTCMAQAQIADDFSGKWTGFITQEEGSLANRYYFELDLQSEGEGKWKGSSFSFIKQKGGKRYVLRLALEAFLRNDTLVLQELRELEYVNELGSNTSYCLKKAHLTHTGQPEAVLAGTWEGTAPKSGSRCSPGKIELRRPPINPSEIDTLTRVQNGRIVSLEKRKVKEGQKLFFTGSNLTLRIFDEGKEDGDVISLLFNNQWILKNYKLKNEPRTIKIQASADRLNNFLICYAHSMGKLPPCTTAIIVSDGKKEKKVILNSDLENCDIVYFEIE